jgi:hypothetical protein
LDKLPANGDTALLLGGLLLPDGESSAGKSDRKQD